MRHRIGYIIPFTISYTFGLEEVAMQYKKVIPSISALLTLAAGMTAMGGIAYAEPSAGQRLAAQCAQCHGTNGDGGFENIAGRNAASLYNGLLEMKARPVEGIMDRQARGYTDEQLWLISEYFATQQSSGGSGD